MAPGLSRSRGLVALGAAVALAACGGHRAPPSTDQPVVETTTTAPPQKAPLTGLAYDAPALAGRAALVVKVDDGPDARPQAGINQADIVFEEQVEGGITRLAAVYQSKDASPVGPVRSARSTDVNLAAAFDKPLFAYSGANKAFLSMIRTAPLVDVGFANQPSDYRPVPGHKAPDNLFSDTAALYAHDPAGSRAPPAPFEFRAPGVAAAAPGIGTASHLQVKFPKTSVTWDFDARTGWRRTQDNFSHVDAVGHQVAAQNVVVQFVEYADTGLKDQSGAAVPVANVIGTGPAWLLTDGKVVKGTWTKSSLIGLTRFVDSAGSPFKLTPGQTWVELATTGTATAS